MTTADQTTARRQGDDRVSSDLITAVVNLVGTGPVHLGAYTAAELFAVGCMLDFLEKEPPEEAVAEAVRSLAARDFISTDAGDETIEVRGDLGIAVTFEQKSHVVIDVRLTGTEPDTPWRYLLMPQVEKITLEAQVDALGIHFYSLWTTDDAIKRLLDQLPTGDRGPKDADLDKALAASPKTALVTVSKWQDGSHRESTDVILAKDKDTMHVFLRDPSNPERFAAQGLDRDDLRELLERLSDPS